MMQNLLMRPQPNAVGLPRRNALLEVKTVLEHGPVIRGVRAPETKDALDDETLHVSPDTKKLFMLLADELKAVREKGSSRHDELQERLDKALIEAKRPRLGTEQPRLEMPKAWSDYLRYGVETPELKSLSVGSNPDGGFLAPAVLSNRIIEVARNRSNIRQIAQTIQITSGAFEIVADPNDLDATWVGEQTARPETTTPQLNKLVFPAHEMYAMPKATQTLLDDANINVEEWLSQRVADKLSRMENAAFVSGDGVSKPRGFMAQNFVTNASFSWGTNVGYIPTGLAGGFLAPTTSVSPSDALVDLVYALKSDYRGNATFVMNSNTVAIVRKFKAADGTSLWQQSLIAGTPSFLLGYPVTIAEDMDDVGAGLFPIAFGDFSRAYIIVDRIGVRILRDPFSAKPYVLFYTTKRVGGGVADYAAYKVLKVALN